MKSLTNKRWILKNNNNTEDLQKLIKETRIPPVLLNILINRGIKTFQDIYDFFNPNYTQFHNPFLLKDMDKALERIERAIENKEKILIYGDYDVDGTTGVALVYSFFKKRYENIIYYIPDRITEGYGISDLGLEFARQNNVKLIIAIDCGIKDNDKVEKAKAYGIDFIICDHHIPDNSLPNAYAILNPKRIDCEYPNKELTGCGIGYKLIQAYSKNKYYDPLTPEVKSYIDLVAISTAADIVPILGENRAIVSLGLKKINTEPSIGIKALITAASLTNSYIKVNDIVFKLGPRINSAGRIKHGSLAVELLLAKDESEALKLAKEINKYNQERRNINEEILEDSLEYIIKNKLYEKESIIVYNDNWHKGVLGIIAARLTQEFYRPSIVLTYDYEKNFYVGSARSIENFDLYYALKQCNELLENFGGHKFAAGLSIKRENLPKFISKFEDICKSILCPEDLIPKIEVDAEINFNQIDRNFFKYLKRFEPYGPGNMNPIFVTKNVKDTGNGKTIGNNNSHLLLELVQDNFKYYFPAIAFNFGNFIEDLAQVEYFNICYSIETYTNSLTNAQELRIKIRDIQIPYIY
mgnify:CR=1 FL=1